MKQSERKQKKEAKKGKKGNDDAEAGEETAEAKEPDEAATFGMNPARLAMMQGPERPQHRSRY
jgi:nucleolar protein 6